MSRVIALISRRSCELALLLILPPIVILVLIDVVGRFFFNKPLAGCHDWVGLILAVVVALSLSHCWVTGGHVRMELVTSRLTPRGKAIAMAASALLGCFYLGAMAWQSWLDAVYAFKYGEITCEYYLITWPCRVLVSIGISIFLFQVFASLIASLRQARWSTEDRD